MKYKHSSGVLKAEYNDTTDSYSLYKVDDGFSYSIASVPKELIEGTEDWTLDTKSNLLTETFFQGLNPSNPF